EVNSGLVPARREPIDTARLAMFDECAVLGDAELDTPAVLEIRHRAPWGIAQAMSLLERHAQFGRALLEFHSVAARVDSRIDQAFGDVDGSIVVNTDLRHDIGRLAVPDRAVSELQN